MLTNHFKENIKGLIPKCDYHKTICAWLVGTGPSSQPSAYDAHSPCSYGQSEEHATFLSSSPSDSPVSSAEDRRVKLIKRRRCEAERIPKRSRVDQRADDQGDDAVAVQLLDCRREDSRNILGVRQTRRHRPI
ncbi:hypothetical protein RRG08_009198 [Elysia crispata]|uniref:Uncharacterized protein n=1 Tax=Elysia crispata TaxID=231223 RepID=A0AAE0Z9J4_9GAST|nr:hypothetical protein RRG08_009198 [Elysia crispata]